MKIAVGAMLCEGNSRTPALTRFEELDYTEGQAMFDPEGLSVIGRNACGNAAGKRARRYLVASAWCHVHGGAWLRRGTFTEDDS